MPVKCNKCGADIPDTAAFCPGCGATKPTTQPQPQPPKPQASTPQYSSQPAPRQMSSSGGGLGGLVNTVFSKMLITLGFGIGILLAWIGSLITLFAFEHANIGTFLTSFGFLGAGFILFGGAFLNNKINRYVRLGMIIVGGWMIITAVVSTGSSIGGIFSSLQSSIPSGYPYG